MAGVTAARSIAQASSQADEIHVFGAERYPYYPRPLLWKFIAGQLDQDDLYFQPVGWYEERGIHLHLDTRVTVLDPSAHCVTLGDESEVMYDRLLLATGARPFVPPCEGTDKEGVFTLRTLGDALAIKAYAEDVSQPVVIGGGLLGLETALALHTAGPDVLVVEIADHLLPLQLDVEGARVLRLLLEARRLHLITGAVVEAILGEERAERVRTEAGQVLDGELVLFSTGIRCRAGLARDAGLEVNRGAIVDGRLRTSAEDVYAAGDIAEFDGKIGGIIPPALEQARVAASNMVDPGSAVYTGTLPSTTLKVAGAQVTSLGEYDADEAEDILVLRDADPQAGVYRKLVVRDGRVVGAILLNDQQRAAVVRRLIDKGTDVSEHARQLVEDGFEPSTLFA